MKIISRVIALILFIAFFGFALKNDQIVTLQYFFGYAQSAPLVILLLVFFLSGAVLGVLAMVPIVFRHRRDISKHKKTIAEIEKERLAEQRIILQGPQADGVRNTISH
jgi:putative membrane protein